MATRKLMVLSEADKKLIEEFLARSRTQARNTAGRPRVPDNPPAGPDVYVAIAPAGGIPARSGTQPGTAECEVYHAIFSGDTPTLVDIGLTLFVLNLGSEVAANAYVIVERDKAGSWYVMGAGGGGSLVVGTGTDEEGDDLTVEEVDGAPSYPGVRVIQFDQDDGFTVSNPSAGVARVDLAAPCGAPDFYVYRYRCQAGNLNEYRQKVAFAFNDDRCLVADVDVEEFVRTVACCDESCIDWTGTATGTFGTSTGTPLHLCCPVGRICVTLTNILNASYLNGLQVQLNYDLGVGYWRGWSIAFEDCPAELRPSNILFPNRDWYIGFSVECDPDTGLWYYSWLARYTGTGQGPPPLSHIPAPKKPLNVGTCNPFDAEVVDDFGVSCMGVRTSMRATFTEGLCTTTGTGTGTGEVTVACCANSIPTVLTLTPVITGNTNCPTDPITLTYNSSSGRWEGTYSGSLMTVYCDGSNWRITGCGISDPGNVPVTAPTCDPFAATFIGAIPSCCSATQIQFVVEEESGIAISGIGTGTSSGASVSSLTVSNVSVSYGLLVVNVVTFGGPTPTVTYDGVSMTERWVSPTESGNVFQFSLLVTAKTASVVVSVSPACAIEVQCINVTGLTNNTFQDDSTAGSAAPPPRSWPTGSYGPNVVALACFLLVVPDAPHTWAGTPTFIDGGQDVTDSVSGVGAVRVVEGRYISSSNQTYDAVLSGVTPTKWTGGVGVYS